MWARHQLLLCACSSLIRRNTASPLISITNSCIPSSITHLLPSIPRRSLMEERIIPRKALFTDAQNDVPKLSPDGRRIVYLARSEKGALNFCVQDVTVSDDIKEQVVATVGERMRSMITIEWQWFGNRHILYSVKTVYGSSALLRLCVTGDEKEPVLVARGFKSFWPLKSNRILLHQNDNQLKVIEVFAESNLTVTTKPVFVQSGLSDDISGFVTSNDLSVMSYVSRDRGTGELKLYVKRGAGTWQNILTPSTTGEHGSAWTAQIKLLKIDGPFLYFLDSTNSNTINLKRVTISPRGVPLFEIIASRAAQDVRHVFFSNSLHVLALAWHSSKTADWVSLSDSFTPHLERMKRSLDADINLLGTDDHMTRFLVSCSKGDRPTTYYLYDARAMTSHFLLTTHPNIMAYYQQQLSPTEVYTIRSRGGIDIDVYATAPKDVPKENLPTVVLVHGGPDDREFWEFSPLSQLLSSRGYLVLDVNYRGSTGYGRAFQEAGYRNWMDVACSDIEDVAAWAISSKYSDPARIAVIGGSFGGYLVFACATRSDIFKCGLSLNGLSDLQDFVKHHQLQGSVELGYYRALFGNPEQPGDVENMKANSPISFSLKFPVMAFYCQLDHIVPPSQTKKFLKVFRKQTEKHNPKHLSVSDYVYIAERHTIQQRYNVTHYYFMMEKYLELSIGGTTEPFTFLDKFYFLFYRWSMVVDVRMKKVLAYFQKLLYYEKKQV